MADAVDNAMDGVAIVQAQKAMEDGYIAELAESGGLVAIALQLIALISQMAIIFGGVVPFVPQYLQIAKNKSAEGFSTYVVLILLFAYTTRICFWWGHPFELPLLLQAVVMVIWLHVFLHLCVSVGGDSKMAIRLRGPTDWEHFWQWTAYEDYLFVYSVFFLVLVILTLSLRWFSPFVELLGMVSLLAEASLGVPQWYRNHQNKSVEGMSVIMVACFLSGDVFKTTYFLLRSAPFQFWFCGSLQITMDLALLYQVFAYSSQRRNQRSRTHHVVADGHRHGSSPSLPTFISKGSHVAQE